MDPRDFHALAARLTAGTAPAPADCRTAINRSYYAVFNVAAEHLRSMGFPVGKGAAAHGAKKRGRDQKMRSISVLLSHFLPDGSDPDPVPTPTPFRLRPRSDSRTLREAEAGN